MFTLDSEITYPYINSFLSEMFTRDDPVLFGMEDYACRNHIPIIQPESARLLETLCALSKPGRILEIGTAIGYSTIILARTLDSSGIIDSVEMDEDRMITARKFIKQAGLEENIRLLHGDAFEVLQCLSTPYDLIFLDAAKGQYPDYLPHCLRLLTPGGLFISDNILYGGMVAKSGWPEHKHRTITVRLREYVKKLCSIENLVTSIVPIGDGMSVSYRKG